MKITKKNGTISLYDDEKVTRSILSANASIPAESISPAMATAFSNEVFARLTKEHEIIPMADVRACVFALLNEKGFSRTAKCYMEYLK